MNALLAVFAIGIKNYFRIGTSRKSMSFAEKLFSEFNVVEDFAVKCDPQTTIRCGHRLRATLQINDAEPRMSQACRASNVHATRIGASVAQRGNHSAKLIAFRPTAIEF